MLNKILMAGRFTADPEIRTVGQSKLCKFNLAVPRQKKKGEETAETDFFSCVAWNKNAEVIYNFFEKGSPIMIVGTLRTSRFEKNGEKRTAVEIRVDEIHFFGGGKKKLDDNINGVNQYTSSKDINDPKNFKNGVFVDEYRPPEDNGMLF